MKNRLTKILLAILILISFSSRMFAQQVYHLWEGSDIPYYKENTLKEYEDEAFGTTCVYNVTDPTLTVYSCKAENSGKAVIILPGGGYSMEAIYHEGHDVARVLAENGITAAVLKYRLPNPESSDQPQLVPVTDTREALNLLRSMSERYGFKNNQVGLIGFSAGSHLATVTTLWESENELENPDFCGFIYGVTDFTGINLDWLAESLYYRKLTKKETAQNQLLKQVTKRTPPAFLVHAYDDDICNVNESLLYAEKLQEHGVPAEMHLFTEGGHGFGLGRSSDGTDQWIGLFINWLKLLEL